MICNVKNKGVGLNPLRQMHYMAVLHKYSQNHETIRGLEIGSWLGASAIVFMICVENFFKDGTLVCCDLWELESDLNKFKDNIVTWGIQDRISLLRGDSRKVLEALAPKSFDVVFIDGNHSYPFIKSDIQQAKRLVKDDGFICGDDMELGYSVCPDADSLKECIKWFERGMSYHPGVTKAVWEEFGIDESYEGFWIAEKDGDAYRILGLEGQSLFRPAFVPSEAWQGVVEKYIRETTK